MHMRFLGSRGKVIAHASYRTIGWANVSPSMSLGLIAGGHIDGSLTLWDASRIVSDTNGSSNGSLLFRQDLHGGRPINCLEFNPQKPTLLGTGGSDGQVQVLSVDRPSQPDIFAGVTTTRHVNSEVVCLAWNRKVQHILATSSNQGLTVIWDLKNKKEVISFKDPANRTRCSALSWNPDIPTQFLVAFNDDTNPCIQMWDMRNCTYPFKEYQEHSRGVTCASFCDLDSNLIVSSARDNRSVCWSTHSGQLQAYSELNLSAPAIKLDWSPCLPGFIAASTSTGTVSVHSISQRQTVNAATYPPKWVRMPCGVAFGFGGKVVTFGSGPSPTVQIHVIPDEPAVINEADRFESYLATDLRPFCNAKIGESIDEHEKLTWTLMSLLFQGSESRGQIIAAMGIDPTEIRALSEKYLGKASKQVAAPAQILQQEPIHGGFGLLGDASSLNPDQLDDLFDQLAKTSEQQQQMGGGFNSGPNSRRGTPRAIQANSDEQIDQTDWTQGPEAIIKQSILIGNVEAAVECCMKCGRYADALFLAASGTPELWKQTRDEYARKQKDPFIRLVGYVLADDMEKFVIHSDLSSWVETLAILITYVSGPSFTKLVEMLGERLEKERFDVRSAVLCYLSCGSFTNAVRIWASMSNTQGSQTQALQDLVEKMSCLFSAIRPSSTESVFSHKILQYATLLANSGRIVAAMRCLILVPDSTESRILKDRIYNAAPSQMGQLVRGPPPFPFEVFDIRPLHIAVPVPMQQQPYQVGGGVPAQRSGYPQAQAVPGTYLANHQPGSSMFANNVSQPPPVHGITAQQPPGSVGYPQRPQMHLPSVPVVATHGFAQQPPQSSLGQVPTVSGMRPMAPHQNPTPAVVTPVPPRVAPAPSIPVRTSQQQAPGYPQSPPPVAAPPAYPQQGSYQTGSIPVAPRGVAPGYNAPIQQGPGYSVSATSPVGGFQASVTSSAPSSYQPGYGRGVAGPPSSGGVSTAPHATANPITPGMPVSWPVPNPIQQGLSPNHAVPLPKAPVGPVGEPVPAQEIGNIQRSFTSLLDRNAQDGNKKKWEDTARKLGELYDKLATGQISRESVQKVKDLADCINRGDFATASRLRVELSASDWERNRSWLFAVQLLLPK